MKKQLKVGAIGLGQRGKSLIEGVMLHMDDVKIVGVCDVYEDRNSDIANKIEEAKGYRPFETTNYKEIIESEEVEVVIVMTSWTDHLRIAIESMEAGKPVGLEVGGTYSIEECWDLVKTYEKTNVPCMLLENCCYGRDEMMALNMVKQGVFGEIIHCSGGYQHDLRYEIGFGKENRHYRLKNYLHKNCENYPTHELGPIAKVLKINRGNRLLTLTSMASKARGMSEYIKANKSDDKELLNATFAQGDVVTTTIKCAGGETIVLTLDTTLPRPYSRGFKVQGTKGLFMEENRSIFLDGEHDEYHGNWTEQWNNIDKYREKYEHPLWKKFLKDGVKGGHGGMDWLVFRAFFECLQNGEKPPIDVYDAAVWMAVTALSEESIAKGGAVVSVPDFTNGKWINPEKHQPTTYGLEEWEPTI